MNREPDETPRPYHHGDLANALVRAALELIETKGVDGFTLREAARVVGVTHGAAYKHFEDKRALLAAVATQGFRMLSEQLRTAAAACDPEPVVRLEAMFVTYIRFALGHRAYYQVMFGPRLNQDERFPELEAAIAEVVGALTPDIEGGLERGVLVAGSVLDVLFGLWSTAHGYVDLVLKQRIRGRNLEKVEIHFRRLLAPHLRGLQGGGDTARDGNP